MSVIWGLPYLFIRVAVRDFSPATLVFARTAPAALLLVPIALARGQFAVLFTRWRIVVLYTVIELAVPWFLLARAEERITSSTAALLVATVPLISAVLARLTGTADRLTWPRILGLGVGFAGVAVLVGIDVSSDLGAVAQVLVVAGCYALGAFIIGHRLSDLPALGVVSASVLLAAIGYAPYGLTHWPHHVSAEAAWAVVGLALVCTALAFLVFFALIAEVGPSRATVITYVNPAVALLLGVTILGEPFTAGLALGFPLIVVGSILATRRTEALAEP